MTKHDCSQIENITTNKVNNENNLKFMEKIDKKVDDGFTGINNKLDAFIDTAKETFATKEEQKTNSDKIETIEKKQQETGNKVFIIVAIISFIGSAIWAIVLMFISKLIK